MVYFWKSEIIMEGQLKKTFELHLPKACAREYHMTAVRCAVATASTIPPQVAAYEMAWPEFGALETDARVQECDQGLDDFRTLLRETSIVKDANLSHKGTAVQFHYCCISFGDYVRICQTKDVSDLERIMREQGGPCDEALFHFLSGDSFKDLQAPASETCFFGGVEIALTLQGDVKRLCFSSLRSPFVEKSSVVDFLKQVFPHAKDEDVSDDMMRFLHSPNSNPEMLNQIMTMADECLDPITSQKMRDLYGCSQCRNANGKMYSCAGCGETRYCGVACQKTHWPKHKQACREKSAK